MLFIVLFFGFNLSAIVEDKENFQNFANNFYKSSEVDILKTALKKAAKMDNGEVWDQLKQLKKETIFKLANASDRDLSIFLNKLNIDIPNSIFKRYFQKANSIFMDMDEIKSIIDKSRIKIDKRKIDNLFKKNNLYDKKDFIEKLKTLNLQQEQIDKLEKIFKEQSDKKFNPEAYLRNIDSQINKLKINLIDKNVLNIDLINDFNYYSKELQELKTSPKIKDSNVSLVENINKSIIETQRYIPEVRI